MGKRHVLSMVILLALVLAACQATAETPEPKPETLPPASSSVGPSGMSLPGLKLDGQLILAVLGSEGTTLHRYDLASGDHETFGRPNPTTPPPLALSPNGRLLAYFAPDDQGALVLWVRDLESGAEHNLGPGFPSQTPLWSANGSRLFYSLLDDTNLSTGRSGTWDSATGMPANLADEPSLCAAWAPDGQALALVLGSRSTSRPLNVDLLRFDGGQSASLPVGEGEFLRDCLRWSPNNRAILVRTQTDESRQASLLDPGSGRVTELTEVQDAFDARWSSDGRYLSFIDVVGTAVYVLDTRTTEVITLAEFAERFPVGSGTWAPVEGNRLAYNVPVGDERGLYLWQPGQTSGQRIYNQPLGEAEWAPDGEHFVFIERNVKENLLTMRVVSTSGADAAVDKDALPIAWQVDQPISYYVAQAVLGSALP